MLRYWGFASFYGAQECRSQGEGKLQLLSDLVILITIYHIYFACFLMLRLMMVIGWSTLK